MEKETLTDREVLLLRRKLDLLLRTGKLLMDGDATHNPEVITQVVDMMDRYNIGYGSVNHNRNRCLDCGYENAETHLEKCPKCGSTHLDKLQRITGYLVGTTDRWNKAKLAELNDRVVHN